MSPIPARPFPNGAKTVGPKYCAWTSASSDSPKGRRRHPARQTLRDRATTEDPRECRRTAPTRAALPLFGVSSFPSYTRSRILIASPSNDPHRRARISPGLSPSKIASRADQSLPKIQGIEVLNHFFFGQRPNCSAGFTAGWNSQLSRWINSSVFRLIPPSLKMAFRYQRMWATTDFANVLRLRFEQILHVAPGH